MASSQRKCSDDICVTFYIDVRSLDKVVERNSAPVMGDMEGRGVFPREQ